MPHPARSAALTQRTSSLLLALGGVGLLFMLLMLGLDWSLRPPSYKAAALGLGYIVGITGLMGWALLQPTNKGSSNHD